MGRAHITTIHKKGNKLGYSNYRGLLVIRRVSRARDLIETEYKQQEEGQCDFRTSRSWTDPVWKEVFI